MFLSGIAILVLTVPVFFPAAMSLGIDPGWLAVLVALHEVIKGSTPFLITDGPDHGRDGACTGPVLPGPGAYPASTAG
jgi:hypothetical protein